MNWWQRWKAKNWDEQPIERVQGFIRVHGDFPPLRQAARWVAKHWREQPIALLGVVAGLIAALAGMLAAVAALIQALRC